MKKLLCISPLGKLDCLYSNKTRYQLARALSLACFRDWLILSLPLLLPTISTDRGIAYVSFLTSLVPKTIQLLYHDSG